MKKIKKYLPIIFLLLFVAALIVFLIIVQGVSRRGPIAPTAPVSKPAAVSCLLSFDIAALQCNGNCTTDSQCGNGQVCYNPPSGEAPRAFGYCRNPACLTSTNCVCPTPVPGTAACQSKLAYKDVASNKADSYTIDNTTLLKSTDTVNPGDKLVFYMTGASVTASTSGKVVWQDVLDPRFTYVDGDACVKYDTASRTVTCDRGIVGPGTNYGFAVRVQVNATATGTSIPNIAQVTTSSTATSSATPSTCSLSLLLPPATCNSICTTDSTCPSGMTCYKATTTDATGSCRNPSCTSATDCICASPTPSPSPTAGPQGGFFIRKYFDTNGNGKQDTGEKGLTWSFQWTKDGGATWNDYQTDETKLGEGGVVYLPEGTQVEIKEKPVDGWTATTATVVDITIKANNNQLMVFGNWKGPAATSTPTPIVTAAPKCNSSCLSNSDCPSSMNCINGFCRNPSCSDSTSCVCKIAKVAPSPTPETLPKSGAIDDTLKLLGAGVGAVLLGLIGLLAL